MGFFWQNTLSRGSGFWQKFWTKYQNLHSRPPPLSITLIGARCARHQTTGTESFILIAWNLLVLGWKNLWGVNLTTPPILGRSKVNTVKWNKNVSVARDWFKLTSPGLQVSCDLGEGDYSPRCKVGVFRPSLKILTSYFRLENPVFCPRQQQQQQKFHNKLLKINWCTISVRTAPLLGLIRQNVHRFSNQIGWKTNTKERNIPVWSFEWSNPPPPFPAGWDDHYTIKKTKLAAQLFNDASNRRLSIVGQLFFCLRPQAIYSLRICILVHLAIFDILLTTFNKEILK